MNTFETAVLKAKTMINEENTKLIDCPDHAEWHQATLFVFPHINAGIWECPVTGGSDNCEHESTRIEYEESFDGRKGNIEICDACEIEIVRGL